MLVILWCDYIVEAYMHEGAVSAITDWGGGDFGCHALKL